jgi:hypothetical protein
MKPDALTFSFVSAYTAVVVFFYLIKNTHSQETIVLINPTKKSLSITYFWIY